MSDYFRALNAALQQAGFALPTLIIDQTRLDANIAQVQRMLPHTTQPRLVVKSLGAMPLLQYIASALKCNNFMVFHLPHLPLVLDTFPQADILLGKPMPIVAVRNFYKQSHEQKQQWMRAPIQWLIDSIWRLQQYLALAQTLQVQLLINIEIDVGLHRGGIQDISQFRALLTLVSEHPQHLKFSGLMGYDAHVGKLPKIIQSAEQGYAQSQQLYQRYIDCIEHEFPHLYRADLCLNGSGSPTFSLHAEHTVCNDLSFGSMLLKPTDFNLPTLTSFQPALWIATPVLKKLPATQIPGLTLLDKIPYRKHALFVYGGNWMADYVYPNGARTNPIYGRSSNQEIVNVPRSSAIEVDDFVFLCPTQSEAVISQFADVWLYRGQDATPYFRSDLQPDFKCWETFRS